MTTPLDAVYKRITEAPVAEASFYAISYVAALQECATLVYQPALRSVTSPAASCGISGDGLVECVVRCRLEAERAAAEQLTTALAREQQTARARERSRGARATVEAAEPGEGTSGDTAAAASNLASNSSPYSPAAPRRRTSSAGSQPGTTPQKPSRRTSLLRPSSGASAGRRSSVQTNGSGVGLGRTREGSSVSAVPPVPPPPTFRVGTVALLLRLGLCRAMGWPVPQSLLIRLEERERLDGPGSSKTAPFAELADSLLSRLSYPQVVTSRGGVLGVAPGPSARTSHVYMELEDVEWRQDVLLEWVEDAFIFALRHEFDTAQTQCLLLDSLLALNVLDEAGLGDPTDIATANDAALEERMADALQVVLCAQACPTTARVVDTVRQRQPVVREVPDPAQLADIEQKRLKATSQKALAALDAAKQNVPLITQTVTEEVSVEVERSATLPAVFTMAQAAGVVDFITRSVMMHRQLWRVVLAPLTPETSALRLRPTSLVPLCAALEELPPVLLPPLHCFSSEAVQEELQAQRRLYEDGAAQLADLFVEAWETPTAALAAEEARQRRSLQEREAQATHEDRAAAMTAQQCRRVERAFELRLKDVVSHNTRVVRDSAAAAGATAGQAGTRVPSPSAIVSPGPTTPAGAQKGKAKKSVAGAAAPAASANGVAATTAVLPSDTVFGLDDVEARVDRIAAAVDELKSGGAASAPGRGGQRKH